MKRVSCATYKGIDAKFMHVESTLTKKLPSFSIVGIACIYQLYPLKLSLANQRVVKKQ
jgi:hypothetical protein